MNAKKKRGMAAEVRQNEGRDARTAAFRVQLAV
jgi:hypothetical protein